MNMKLLLWILIFIISIAPALAQTGLFSAEGGASFASIGIVIIIIFFVVKEIAKQIKSRK